MRLKNRPQPFAHILRIIEDILEVSPFRQAKTAFIFVYTHESSDILKIHTMKIREYKSLQCKHRGKQIVERIVSGGHSIYIC